MNFTNITIVLNDYILPNNEGGVCTVSFESVISVCQQWKGYSTFAHNTYIIPIGLYYFLKLIKKFWNPEYHYTWKGLRGNLNEKYSLFWIEELQDMCRMFLFMRIVQVWIIINFMLN